MTKRSATCRLPSSEATSELAQTIARILVPGDVVLLDGPIGAGKTHFARSLIQSLMEVPEDVPSPTFTLVQTYEVPTGELWHADLYRLSHVDEVEELGLIAAFDDAICLIEWPEKLEDLRPENALTLRFSLDEDSEDARQMELVWSADKWDSRLKGIMP
ncbi:tRNA (adenosine(37)-N6)-threonylcarbamoyltransferase complex ATPase subunit type 1 TsaE [Epibacterium sp. MM17-32]|uniref:tRNA (adenosine(37)-N6)-threonylcarbamoyltransferase complex ATPase subunit type 1 TsaE n=1 Tax=Epibacterium sp. MM17-32 TaxID=2917734 RepID=UPI001EF51F85|nr:tRNA (adenosine(37)-N6)-threonylcarbamoyltransferase complex ATPase subunit type 1 TsaE [Epibacterium sp. MM17-32]MCG7628264.1 tRNA (adenosine(37)-N6)-threonylcarbamoyltransferase complex ATPase subunit type 1 TsaE [Epibacterium sp. MM17-32]